MRPRTPTGVGTTCTPVHNWHSDAGSALHSPNLRSACMNRKSSLHECALQIRQRFRRFFQDLSPQSRSPGINPGLPASFTEGNTARADLVDFTGSRKKGVFSGGFLAKFGQNACICHLKNANFRKPGFPLCSEEPSLKKFDSAVSRREFPAGNSPSETVHLNHPAFSSASLCLPAFLPTSLATKDLESRSGVIRGF